MRKREVLLVCAVAVAATSVGVLVRQRDTAEGSLALIMDAGESTNGPLKYVPSGRVSTQPAEPNPTPVAQAINAQSESTLLVRLHELGISDPPLSLTLAREALRRFPDSPHADEYEWNVVKSLFNMHRMEDAKQEAQTMVWKYPNSDLTHDVERHLLHPQPNPSIAP